MSRLLQHPAPARRGRQRWISRGAKLLTAALLLPLSACATLGTGFLVSPHGTVALQERHHALIVGIILLFIGAPVAILVPLIAWHYRINNARTAFRPNWGFSWILEVLIWVPPALTVVVLGIFLDQYCTSLDPYKPVGKNAMPVDVVGLDWKWLFLYPDQHVATVNQLVIPVGRPIHFYITSGTVMQSLLMPELAGQIALMDGMVTQLNFNATTAGGYWGENTQYNGDGYNDDRFSIKAVSKKDFAQWVMQAQANPHKLDRLAYQNLSRKSRVPKPEEFGQYEPNLFKLIVSQAIPAGYLSQEHEGPNGGPPQHNGGTNVGS